MRVLLLSALYPPKHIGGAEMCAESLAEYLAAEGNDVGVVRATDRDEPEGDELTTAGVRIWRVRTPHLYPAFRFPEASSWQKPIWHLQDHFDGRIRPKIGRILNAFRPDLVNIHLIQGLGYPLLEETAARAIPITYTLHDLGLACIRMSMFKDGHDCVTQCTGCKLSARYKQALIAKQKRVTFISPSRANLETLKRFFPIAPGQATAILNPNTYLKPTIPHVESGTLRLLYAGRLHESKGVRLLLDAVESLAAEHDVSLALAGSGFQEAELRARFGGRPWCRFLGFLGQQDLANAMAGSDILCTPSIWAENSPGVVIHALSVGLPVLGSDRGGIPELVRDGMNGALVRDLTAEGWARAIRGVLDDRRCLGAWRAYAIAHAADFDQPAIGAKILDWMRRSADLATDDASV